MSSGAYYNHPVADWARQHIGQRVVVRTLFSSRLGKIFTYVLLFSVPAAFFLLGLIALALGAHDPATRYGPFVFSFLLLFPCGLIALLGAYVRRGFASSLDANGVNGSMGLKFPWGKLYYINHVTKHIRGGGVSRQIKDNQLELVFEGGKVIIPPMIHDRDKIWSLINSLPAEVRDDGVIRPTARTPKEKALLDFLHAAEAQRKM